MNLIKLFKSISVIGLSWILSWTTLPAQGINIGFNCTGGAPGDTVCMDVTTSAIDSMLSGEMTLTWNQLALEFVDIRNMHPALSGPFTLYPNQTFGRMKMLWISHSFDRGTSFNDGDILYTICFIARGAPGIYQVSVLETNADPSRIRA